ncbi:hypothetical protein AVEN_213193-1, partial [Araneus ventricosus]
ARPQRLLDHRRRAEVRETRGLSGSSGQGRLGIRESQGVCPAPYQADLQRPFEPGTSKTLPIGHRGNSNLLKPPIHFTDKLYILGHEKELAGVVSPKLSRILPPKGAVSPRG